MSETQEDEEQWLYGGENKETSEIDVEAKQDSISEQPQINGEIAEDNIEDDQKEKQDDEAEQNDAPNDEKEDDITKTQDEDDKQTDDPSSEVADEDKEKNDEDSSSDDDEPTVTIGKIVKQPDIIKPPPPTIRTAATTGLKDEDFEVVGKVNGVDITDLNLTELEEKPWRKPGSDLSDYFNYGFSEQTWIKYCERQRTMRVQESGVGLGGLGGIQKLSAGSSNIPVSIVNENSKYGGLKPFKITTKTTDTTENNIQGSAIAAISTIQVMTAEKRTYSNKVSGNVFEKTDFSGPPPYGDFYRPPPPYFSGPPPTFENPSWNPVHSVPPPGWTGDNLSAPPPTVSSYYDENNSSSHYRDRDRSRDDVERGRSRDREEGHRSRERESRHRRRSRSRSRSRSRHKKRSRSRSRSPSHRHKRKKSKRDKDSPE